MTSKTLWVGWRAAGGLAILTVSVLADAIGIGSGNGGFGRLQIAGVVTGFVLVATDAAGIKKLSAGVRATGVRLRNDLARIPAERLIAALMVLTAAALMRTIWLRQWRTVTVIAGICILAAAWSWASATEARPRTYVATGVGIGLLTAVATLAVPYGPVDCSSGKWPAFMLSDISTEQGDEYQGWILWCHETHWTMHVAGEVAGETSSRQARGKPAEVFPWFKPSLTPQEAWQELTGSAPMREVKPRNDFAEIAYAGRGNDGYYRMEFTSQGIPVLVKATGSGGFLLRADDVSFADRPMRSNDELLNSPACYLPGVNGFINEPRPCWYESGSLRLENECFVSLYKATTAFPDLGCAI